MDMDFENVFKRMIDDDSHRKRQRDVAYMLSKSIARGTQHFDRENMKRLFEECICDTSINPDCPLHKDFRSRSSTG